MDLWLLLATVARRPAAVIRLPTLPLSFMTERVVVHPDLRGWNRDPNESFAAAMETWYFVAPSQ